jgi:adenylate kinase family enzyme
MNFKQFNQHMLNEKLALFIFGLPGSGKSTITQALIENSNFIPINIGFLLRQLASSDQDSDDIRTARSIILAGCAAPNDLAFKLIRNTLDDVSTEKIVFDGYLRSLEQILSLESLLSEYNIKAKNIIGIWLNANENVIRERLSLRMVCPKCGFSSTKISNICPICKISLERRIDDVVNIIQKRIDVFEKDIIPIIQIFKEKYKLLVVSCNDKSEKEVFYEASNWLESISKA